MARQMTSSEKQRFLGFFPNLDVDNAVVTGEVSIVYHCIAWTVGISNRWIWPGNSLADFDTFYHGFGLVRSGDGTITAWGLSSSQMTHGSVSGPGHGPRWESKCGYDLRIQHGLNELVSSSYGRVLAFYRKSRTVAAIYEVASEVTMQGKIAKSYLSLTQKRAIQEERKNIPVELRASFDTAFSAWKSTWFSGGLAVSSNPNSRAIGKEYDALIALGPAILPLVIEQLADPDNFFALQLYDAIQPNEKLVVQFAPDDERILEGEQGRAQRVVQVWFANK
jgi:hypothetical protein